MQNLILLSVLFTSSFAALASSLSIDVGQTTAVYNRFAIPNTNKDRISLPVEKTLTSYRLTGYYDLSSGNQIYFLIAPLATSYNFNASRDFEFASKNFTAGTNTDVNYKFNSYRLGYLWQWKISSFRLWTGLVGKIRDAQIEVTQGDKYSTFDNIGFVPLASFGAEWLFFESLSLYTHTDALGASQGSAYDSQVEVKLNLGNFSFSVGNRILGGGVDNDTVYNFAQFNTTYTRLSFQF